MMVTSPPPTMGLTSQPVQPDNVSALLERRSPLRTKDFLDLVLPGMGLRCIVHIHGERKDHTFHVNNGQAAARALELDATGKGDVYFAVAAFREAGSRKAINAWAVRSSLLDLDTAELKGEGNAPYANRQEALSELERFGFELALPAPLVVSSGYGFHVYWPMDADLTPVEWRETAHALKRACDTWGLKADHSRTTDVASLLRVPGTYNRKNPAAPQRVEVL